MSYSEKQVQILNTAEKLFACKGFDGTSVRDIAEAAGINIAMISYYFGSKEKLMQALFEHRANTMVLQIESLLKNDQLSPEEKLFVMIESHVDRIFSRQSFFKIMLSEQLLDKSELIRCHVSSIKQRTIEAIDRLIRHGQDQGAFRPGIDVPMMMNAITGTVVQSIVGQEFYKNFHQLGELSPEAFTGQLKANLLDFLKKFVKAIVVYEA
ncbi:TetR family transcriptional regulator [Paraflavisolibacter sp. H34]|uniref:TetR/AcrR family transcriptional regulator n=1 Tax=Huijunlia imazamoxiresistens TaxID=3127457 RepID=UPI0030180B06